MSDDAPLVALVQDGSFVMRRVENLEEMVAAGLLEFRGTAENGCPFYTVLADKDAHASGA